MQAQDLIDEILHMTGVVAAVDTPSSLQRNTCLAIFNSMLDLWNGEGLLSPYSDTATYNLTTNIATYSIGPGGQFSGIRPLEILMAEIRDSTGHDTPMGQVSWTEMEALLEGVNATGRPTQITYQKKSGQGIIKMCPPPDAAYSIRLTTTSLFASLALSDSIDNNPGYLEAFKYNIAPRVAIYYSRQIDGGIVVLGENALRVLRRKAIQLSNAPVASGVLRQNKSYDIDQGE